MNFTFNHTNLNVRDLQRSLAFYQEALGLQPVREIEASDGSFKLGDLSISGGAKISLLDARNARDELMAAIAPLLRADGAFLVQVEAVRGIFTGPFWRCCGAMGAL